MIIVKTGADWCNNTHLNALTDAASLPPKPDSDSLWIVGNVLK